MSHSVISFSLIHIKLEWNSVSRASTSPNDQGLEKHSSYFNNHLWLIDMFSGEVTVSKNGVSLLKRTYSKRKEFAPKQRNVMT